MKIIAIILLLLAIQFSAAAQDKLPGSLNKYRIVYNVLFDKEKDDYEVFSMNADGSDKRNISNWKGVDWAYTAYKDKVYWISDRGACHRCYFLYESDAYGNNLRKVSEQRLQDSWLGFRNKGREAVIDPRHEDREKQAFWLIDTATGKMLKELPVKLASINDPLFSADGKHIIFRGSEEKSTPQRKKFDELFVMDADGGNLRQLTTYPADDKTAPWHSYHAGPPRWNSKLKMFTYQSFQQGKYQLFGIGFNGGAAIKIGDFAWDAGWHDWTANGRWLAIEMETGKQPYSAEIYLYDMKTKALKKITSGDFRIHQAPTFALKPKEK
jgi:TolB protein